MSSAFSSNDVEVLSRKINIEETLPKTDSLALLHETYEIPRCIQHIKENNYTKVALQFPDYMLADAAEVAYQLQHSTSADFYVLADTSYGSFDVDEVAAQHIQTDLIIHYGKASVVANTKTPTIYVFGAMKINIDPAVNHFMQCFPERTERVLVLSSACYISSLDMMKDQLQHEYPNLSVVTLKLPDQPKPDAPVDNDDFCTNSCPDCSCRIKSTKTNPETVDPSVFEFQSFVAKLQETTDIDDYSLFFIGNEKSEMLQNFQLQHPNCKGFIYNPAVEKCTELCCTINKFLMKRYFITEKVKDAKTVGILVGTMGMAGFREIIRHLKDILKQSGKKSYTFVVGKLNPQKLANFPEIDIFVMVACPEETIVDGSDFYKPIATPYEVEVACNANRQWGENYVTNFTELLPDGKHFVEFSPHKEVTVSLVSGNLRGVSLQEQDSQEENNQLDTIREKALSVFHPYSSAQFYAGRTWQGLEQKLGETPVGDAKEGRSGLPMTYTHEM
uniref:Diphthamide biosynthesis protein 2 n=1 Tax=Phallusia mammillata TaxID=59560 RepID=A0A6F9DAL6_9ASCI|nr:diphthamide biosynthesis protein 2 [Phallusia mammillata]